jgi:hypothetical protein
VVRRYELPAEAPGLLRVALGLMRPLSNETFVVFRQFLDLKAPLHSINEVKFPWPFFCFVYFIFGFDSIPFYVFNI